MNKGPSRLDGPSGSGTTLNRETVAPTARATHQRDFSNVRREGPRRRRAGAFSVQAGLPLEAMRRERQPGPRHRESSHASRLEGLRRGASTTGPRRPRRASSTSEPGPLMRQWLGHTRGHTGLAEPRGLTTL
jgi:hypothetical protein